MCEASVRYKFTIDIVVVEVFTVMQAGRQRQSAPCGATVNGIPCNETKSLDVVHEFNKIYQDQLERIDRMAGDSIEVYTALGVVTTQTISFCLSCFSCAAVEIPGVLRLGV